MFSADIGESGNRYSRISPTLDKLKLQGRRHVVKSVGGGGGETS